MTSIEQHAHAHPHEPALAPRQPPGFSLLRLSAVQRFGLVTVALALLWGGVYWALT